MEGRSLFGVWADRQGVSRPFEALVQMDKDSRRSIAELLSIDLESCYHRALGYCKTNNLPPNLRHPSVPEAEACLVIGQNRKGIQARSHSTWRTLSPWHENHTWSEILQSIINELDIPMPAQSGARPKDEELEAAIFEYFADQVWNSMDPAQKEEIEKFLQEQPGFAQQMMAAGFGPVWIRILAAAVFKAATKGGFGTYITAVKAAAWFNAQVGTKLAMQVVTAGLKTFLRSLKSFYGYGLLTISSPSSLVHHGSV